MQIERVEVVTVSPAGARINWRSMAGGEEKFEDVCAAGGGKTHSAKVETLDGVYNLAVFDKLEPDTSYSFHISDKKSARVLHKGRFKTLAPPPGDFLFRFATINDIHVGEKIAGWLTLPGLEFIPLTPGFKLEVDGKPYWRFTSETVVAELNRLDIDFVIVKGDLTADQTSEQFETAKEMLDTLKHPYYVLRGNHDRRGDAPEDYFAKTFGPDARPRSFEHKGHAFILLDCVHPRTGFAHFSGEELDRMEAELARLRDIPAFVFLHNPPLRFLERAFMTRRARFLRALDSHPRLAGVFYGHTHANKRAARRSGGRDVPFVETAATVEFPGGYNVYDVHSGGYTQICLRPHDARCYRWYAMTEREYHGLAPLINFGGIEDRNFMWKYPEKR